MNDKERAAMQQALEALEEIEDLIACYTYSSGLCYAAKAALREALDHFRGVTKKVAEQAEQEPVAWFVQYKNRHEFVFGNKPEFIIDGVVEPLYAAPVRTKDLTEEDINELWNTALMIADPTAGNLRFKFARAVIAADRGKNK